MDFRAAQHPRHTSGKFARKVNDAPTPLSGARTLPNGRPLNPGVAGVDGQSFEAAHIDPDVRWNGFACPMFTRDVAEEIVAWANAGADEGESALEWEGDALIDVWRDGANEDRAEVARTTLSDGTVLYGVGSFSWAWSEPIGE